MAGSRTSCRSQPMNRSFGSGKGQSIIPRSLQLSRTSPWRVVLILAVASLLAACAGALAVAHANDSFFWLVTGFGEMDVSAGYRNLTAITLHLTQRATPDVLWPTRKAQRDVYQPNAQMGVLCSSP
jgi:hypothetical protein